MEFGLLTQTVFFPKPVHSLENSFIHGFNVTPPSRIGNLLLVDLYFVDFCGKPFTTPPAVTRSHFVVSFSLCLDPRFDVSWSVLVPPRISFIFLHMWTSLSWPVKDAGCPLACWALWLYIRATGNSVNKLICSLERGIFGLTSLPQFYFVSLRV